MATGKTPSNKLNSTLKIAVSANFSHALKKLLPRFEKSTGINTQIFIGSTGNLFQQIHHGATYDIFIAADSLRPQALIEANKALDNSLRTYAFGTISFWSAQWQKLEQTPENLPTLEELINRIKRDNVRLAIANHNIAPYGLAAKQVIESNNLWHIMNKKQLITGSNINQTFQQVRSGAVPLGIVADSQLIVNSLSGVAIPSGFYQPIEQQLVIISASNNIEQAQLLSQFLLSTESQNTIKTLGYKPANYHVHNPTSNSKTNISKTNIDIIKNGSSKND